MVPAPPCNGPEVEEHVKRGSPSKKTVLIYFLVLVALLALVSVALGGAGWFRTVRLVLLYGLVFLAVLSLLRYLRRR